MGDTVLTVILNIHDELPETDCEVKLVCFMMRRDAHLKEDIQKTWLVCQNHQLDLQQGTCLTGNIKRVKKMKAEEHK